MDDLEGDLKQVILEYCIKHQGHEVSFAEFFALYSSVNNLEKRLDGGDVGSLIELVLSDLEQEGYLAKTESSPASGGFRCYKILDKRS